MEEAETGWGPRGRQDAGAASRILAAPLGPWGPRSPCLTEGDGCHTVFTPLAREAMKHRPAAGASDMFSGAGDAGKQSDGSSESYTQNASVAQQSRLSVLCKREAHRGSGDSTHRAHRPAPTTWPGVGGRHGRACPHGPKEKMQEQTHATARGARET